MQKISHDLRLAKRMSRLGTETAFEVLVRAKALEKQGKDIVHLEIGEPDFDTPANIIEAASEALHGGWTHYGPSAGLPDLRQTIADYVGRTRKVPVAADQVVVVPGGKPIIFYTILSLAEQGDEVIYPNPGFPIYESMINFVGAKAVPIQLRESMDFRMDANELRDLITDRTRLIIINSPQNPTGAVLTERDVRDIANAIGDRDIMVLSDEIYSRLIFEGQHHSILSLDDWKDRTILLDGFSKTYAMTGWRMGYGVMRADLANHVARLMTNSNSCTASFTQMAGIEALTGRSVVGGHDVCGIPTTPRHVHRARKSDQRFLVPVTQGRVLHFRKYHADGMELKKIGRCVTGAGRSCCSFGDCVRPIWRRLSSLQHSQFLREHREGSGPDRGVDEEESLGTCGYVPTHPKEGCVGHSTAASDFIRSDLIQE